jgi:hypothetical protein
MSFIACTEPCVYQKDGYCSLTRAASCGKAPYSHGCLHFVPTTPHNIQHLQQSSQCLSDIRHTN